MADKENLELAVLAAIENNRASNETVAHVLNEIVFAYATQTVETKYGQHIIALQAAGKID